MTSPNSAGSGTARDALKDVCEKAIDAYERWQHRGRISGDDTLLYEYGKLVTPSAVLSLLTELSAAQSDLSRHIEIATQAQTSLAQAEAKIQGMEKDAARWREYTRSMEQKWQKVLTARIDERIGSYAIDAAMRKEG